MSLSHDLEDSWFQNEILKNQITELNKQLKQKDAEIEKKDAVLKEAIEIIKRSKDRSSCNDFFKKIEVEL